MIKFLPKNPSELFSLMLTVTACVCLAFGRIDYFAFASLLSYVVRIEALLSEIKDKIQ